MFFNICTCKNIKKNQKNITFSVNIVVFINNLIKLVKVNIYLLKFYALNEF